MNKVFAFILFVFGIVLLLVGACGNFVFNEYVFPEAIILTAWGIIWRILLGLLLIVVAVALGNMETFGGGKSDY